MPCCLQFSVQPTLCVYFQFVWLQHSCLFPCGLRSECFISTVLFKVKHTGVWFEEPVLEHLSTQCWPLSTQCFFLSTQCFSLSTQCLWHSQAAMTSWTLEAFMQELEATEKLLKVRPELADKLCSSLQCKLTGMKATAADLVQLYSHLAQSLLPESWLDQLRTSLDQLCGTPDTALKATIQPQQCDSLSNYLTSSEWAQVEKGSLWEGAATLAAVLKKLGLQSLKESTKKVATGILLVFELRRSKKLPCYNAIYSLQQHVSASFASCQVKAVPGVAPLANYPCEPEALGSEWMGKVFPAEQPEKRFLPELANLVQNHVVVRSTSKKLHVGTQQPAVQGVASGGGMPGQPSSALAPPSVPQETFLAEMRSWMKSTQEAFHQLKEASKTPAAAAESNLVKALAEQPPQCPERLPLADTAPKNDQNTLKQPEGSLEEYEQKAFDLLCANQKKQTPASKTQVKKPPATVGKVFKKPAAAKSAAKSAAATQVAKTGKSSGTNRYTGALGCVRCRGNSKSGCESCRKADFAGQRLPSRDAWRKWFEAKQRKQG